MKRMANRNIKQKESTRVCESVRACVRPRENDNHDDNDEDEELQNRTYKKGSLSPNDSPRQRERHNLLFLSLSTNKETPRQKLQTPETLCSHIQSLNFLLEDELRKRGRGPGGNNFFSDRCAPET